MNKLVPVYFLGVLLLTPLFTFAITYFPGETLDPACLPTDPSCTVSTILSVANGGTGTSTFGGVNHVLYTTSAGVISSETDFFYDSAANRLSVSTIRASSLLEISGGSQAAIPGLVFTSDTDTGIYQVGSNILGIGADGTAVARFGVASSSIVTGKFGIGTTAPGFDLSVVGNELSSSIASFTNLSTPNSASTSVLRIGVGTPIGVSNIDTRFVQFFASTTNDSDGVGVGNIRLNDTGVVYVSGNADLAEYVDVTESVAPGDIIASLPAGNQKALAGNFLLGVVTDTAAFIGNETEDLTGKAIVGMLGRVNTKVSTENGNISIGDPIVASSVAGVGMRQTTAGPSIGKALEAYSSPGVSRIPVQVVPGWFDPDPLSLPSSFTISGPNVLDQNLSVVTRVGGFRDIFAGTTTIANRLTLGSLNGPLQANAGVVSATSSIGPLFGGTGLTSAPSFGNLLVGNLSGGYTLTSTSSLGLLTTGVAEGANLYYTNTRFDNRLSATTTLPNLTTLVGLTALGGSATTVTVGNTTGAATTTIQSGTGNINFQVVGTGTTGRVQVGAGGAGSATPDLLVLDTKSTSGDPTGVNGAMYYNVNTNKFRCFENSAWRDCETGPRTATLNDVTSDALTITEAELLDGTAPSITPRSTTNRIWIVGTIRITPAGGDAETNTFRVRRGSGSCAGTQVGSDITLDTTMVGISSNVSINLIDSPATASAQAYTVCGLTSTATTPNSTPHIMLTITEVAAAGADLAELYSTTDTSIESGDVVAIDPSVEKGVLKTSKVHDPLALGVVSTLPGLLMDDGVVGNHVVQVALAGRLPVKVTTENGAIKPGDYLTPSSVAGVAMKATGSGPVIAQAIGVYDSEGVGLVLAFVKNFDSVQNALLGDVSSPSTSIDTIQSETSHNPITVIAQKITDGVQFLTDFVAARVTAIRGYFDEVFAKKIHTDELCLKKSDGSEVCVSGDQVEVALGASNTPVAAQTPAIETSTEALIIVNTTPSSATSTSPTDDVSSTTPSESESPQ